jgi:phosphatidylglycerophosphatase A
MMEGATGIVLDDVVAGIWALAIAHLINATLF